MNAARIQVGQVRSSTRSANRAQPLQAAQIPDALLTIRTVSALTSLSASTVYRKVAAGQFPKPIRLGKRCTRWHAGSVGAWVAAQLEG